MKRVLVTGAGGCLGRHAVAELVRRGWQVHGVTTRESPPSHDGVVWHRADLLQVDQMTSVVEAAGATHLLHLAWFVTPGRWASSPENFKWVGASLSLLDAFQRTGGTRVVTAGSCLEYDWTSGYCSERGTPCAPHTVYGVCKHALARLTAAFADTQAISSAWGRIFFLYGPHEHPARLVPSVIQSLLLDRDARCSHGNQVRDYLFVQDVADAFAAVLESDLTGPINIASGRPVQLREIVVRIGQLIGRPERIRLGAIDPAPTDVPLVVADVSRLRNELDWRPVVDLDDGLKRTIDWWRSLALVPSDLRSGA